MTYKSVLWQQDDEITSEKLQQMSDNVSSLKASFILPYGLQGATFGAPPAPFDQIKFQAGTSVVNTNLSGGFVVTYPLTYPTGVITVVVCGGDIILPYPTGLTITLIGDQSRLDSFGGIARRTYDDSGVEGQVRVNWISLGW